MWQLCTILHVEIEMLLEREILNLCLLLHHNYSLDNIE